MGCRLSTPLLRCFAVEQKLELRQGKFVQVLEITGAV